MKNRTVVVLHSYLAGREQECAQGLYPRHHLWGIDALAARGWDVRLIDSTPGRSLLARINSRLGGRFGNLEQEARVLRQLRAADVIYAIIAADLFWLVWLRQCGLIRARIVTWFYTPPAPAAAWKPRGWRQSKSFGSGIDAALCLTERAAAHYRAALPYSRVEQLDWGVDTEMFRPGADGVKALSGEPFFLGCGKTERDWPTLIAGVTGSRHRVRLIVPESSLAGQRLPDNVQRYSGPTTAFDDRGISYSRLIDECYAPAAAFLIPLLPSPDNASGFTNLLEAFAMGKPVVMTRTGCLDIDIEAEGVGLYVEPGDPAGWAHALDRLAGDPALVRAMGSRARRLAEERFSYARFGDKLAAFFDQVCPARE